MKTIYKYPLEITDYQTIMMPSMPRMLCVQMQGSYPYIWAQVDTDRKPEPQVIRIIGTGNLFDDSDYCKYIGTVQDRSLVWHVFESLQSYFKPA